MVAPAGGALKDEHLCGVVELEGANAVFVDPVKLSSTSYCHYRINEAEYYSRSLDFAGQQEPERRGDSLIAGEAVDSYSRKRKRSRKKSACLNEKEILAEARHQEVREVIIKAHAAYQNLQPPRLVKDDDLPDRSVASNSSQEVVDFVKLADIWQAPFYTITLENTTDHAPKASSEALDKGGKSYHLFNNMIRNENPEEVMAECSGCQFLVPRDCKFFMSDIKEVQQLVSVDACDGYNLLLLDPPWENKSVKRKSLYPTLPSRYLLSLPIRRLAHPSGALVGLWLTNREKLHQFVENELFPTWGVVPAASWLWLKVTPDGKMLSPLDLAHHKPYECLLLGYVGAAVDESKQAATNDVLENSVAASRKDLPDKHVIISVPGDHSRKPTVGSLLLDYAPGPRPVRGLELFARELNAGWTSWGNEPLHFQSLKHFTKISEKSD